MTLDRLDNKYYVTWGSSLTASATPAGSSGKDGEAAVPMVSGGSLPPQGKMLGKLDQKDFKQVIAKGMKTYGMFQVFLTNELFDTARLTLTHALSGLVCEQALVLLYREISHSPATRGLGPLPLWITWRGFVTEIL